MATGRSSLAIRYLYNRTVIETAQRDDGRPIGCGGGRNVFLGGVASYIRPVCWWHEPCSLGPNSTSPEHAASSSAAGILAAVRTQQRLS